MLNVCFYFQVHQPYRIRPYPLFDISSNHDYFTNGKNRSVLERVAHKCYLPMNNLWLELLKQYPQLKISFSLSGVVLDQFQEYCPAVLCSFQDLVATGQVELMTETYYHSLAFLYSRQEFTEQLTLHRAKIKKLFGVTPTVLRNTELIYNNDLAQLAQQLGYRGVLIEGADKVLGWRSPNFVYRAAGTTTPLLLKNYRLSDDVAFRFSEPSWAGHPLKADTYAHWINETHGSGQTVNLFMDYETFGEHQWADSGIFNFMRHLPGELLKHPDTTFAWPSDIIKQCKPVAELDIPDIVSWADIERDTSAWLGNQMQQAAIGQLYELEQAVKQTGDAQLLNDWRRLQTSDHFYYMCTKWFNDGDVHKYFNPYESPYDAFIYFMNVVKDLKHRIAQPEPQIARATEQVNQHESIA